MNRLEGEALRALREQMYTLFGCRRDALFELLDAVLTAPILETPAYLSLAPSCRPGWGSLYDALNAGRWISDAWKRWWRRSRLNRRQSAMRSIRVPGRAVTRKPALNAGIIR
jgi:hypothetical protein